MKIFLLIYSNLLFIIKNILLILVIFNGLKMLVEILKLIKDRREHVERVAMLKKGGLNINDINELTPKEFKEWSMEFLYSEGFINFRNNFFANPVGIDFICSKGLDNYFVKCKKNNLLSKYRINSNTCKELLGAMAANKINKGIIIASGSLTKDAANFITTMPNNYEILIFDQERLMYKYRLNNENIILKLIRGLQK